MSGKKILVIGAGQSCLGLIKTIKSMGLVAVVVGSKAELPGMKTADHSLIAQDDDVNAVVAWGQQLGIDGIVPTPVDRTLLWIAQVAEALELPFIDPASVQNFRHKFAMKQAMEKARIPCAKGLLTELSSIDMMLLKNFDFPLIVKPIDGYASRGVTKAESFEDLVNMANEAASFSSDSKVVIEEFIEGREFNAEGVCFNGKVEVYAIVEKISDPFPRTVEMGHIIPPAISREEDAIIVKAASEAVLALGMKNGAFNAEVKLHKGLGYVIEVNGRLAGDFIISHLVKPTTGQDMEQAVVNVSMGIAPEPAMRDYEAFGMISFFNLPVGKKIKTVADFQGSQNPANLIWAHLFFGPEDVIPEVTHMGHRSGFVIVKADSRKEMFDLALDTQKTILNSIEFY